MGKLDELQIELDKYQKKLRQLETDWSASRGGSRYGDEYLETQVKVYQAMIVEVKMEIEKLRKKRYSDLL